MSLEVRWVPERRLPRDIAPYKTDQNSPVLFGRLSIHRSVDVGGEMLPRAVPPIGVSHGLDRGGTEPIEFAFENALLTGRTAAIE